MADKNVFIKFDPQKISAVAVNLESQQKRLQKSIANINKKTESLMVSWQSDSATAYIEKERKLYARGEEMAQILLSFSQDLATVSGIYKTGEEQAKKGAESLPVDGVFLV